MSTASAFELNELTIERFEKSKDNRYHIMINNKQFTEEMTLDQAKDILKTILNSKNEGNNVISIHFYQGWGISDKEKEHIEKLMNVYS
jgi:hypothetical protein